MFDNIKLSESLFSGIRYLKKTQLSDGSFISFSSPSKIDFLDALQFHSVFSTTLILQSLTRLPQSKQLQSIKEKAVLFLMSQKSEYTSWNYWPRESKEYEKMPYPDDLDDTFCAMSALFLHDPKIVSVEMLANVTQQLTLLETQEGGPYKTWLVGNDADPVWKDTDLGVNSNIAYFLHLQGITLPGLTKYFKEAIETEKFTTPYYPNSYPVMYFLSRFVTGKLKKNLLDILLRRRATSSLNIALKTAALLNLGYKGDKLNGLMNLLLSLQQRDGSWPIGVFYTGVNPDRNKKFYAGSAALTTGLAIEALSLYKSKVNEKKLVEQVVDDNGEKIYHDIVKTVKKRFKSLGPNLQHEGKQHLSQVLKKDRDKQVTLLPYYFAKSLPTPKISDSELVSLGEASVYGWIAYTIYDNFLDEEARISSLPLANVCLRNLTDIFGRSKQFASTFHSIMDKLEEANTWEVTYCRFDPRLGLKHLRIPHFKNQDVLAHRSLGHALGCLMLLSKAGIKESSPDAKNLLLFFHHFLIARQLNDDAHDWEQDLKKGQINYVGALLLQKKRTHLQKLFWNETIDEVCNLIELHSKEALKSLYKINILKTPTYLSKLVEKQMKSVEMVRKEKQQTLAFLSEYQKVEN